MDKAKYMRQWDFWRKQIADGDGWGSAPRDWFESILDMVENEQAVEADAEDFCRCGQVKHVGMDICVDCWDAIRTA